jgi:hypothetical protein
MDFYAAIDDGGPDLNGTRTIPTFLLNTAGVNGPGLVFDATPDENINGGSWETGSLATVNGPGLYASGGAIVPTAGNPPVSQPVSLNGILLRLLVDTTGITNNTANDISIPLNVAWPETSPFGPLSTSFISSTGATIAPTIVPGSIVIPGTGLPQDDPPLYTTSPPDGSTLTDGAAVTVSNAAPLPTRGRDAGGVSNVVIGNGLNGSFSLSPALEGGGIAPGTSRSSTVSANDAGLLNGTQMNGTLSFETTPGPNGNGNAGPHAYLLSATASGNSGTQASRVASGGSYAGLSGQSDKSLGSVAEILAGVNNDIGPETTVTMTWRERNPNETTPNGTTPPLPPFAVGLLTDVVNMTGADGDLFVLQMTYDENELTGDEAMLAALGKIYLVSFDTAQGMWVNAVDLNHGPNLGPGNVQGPWTGQLVLGTWGVDTANNHAWAVLDHNSEFAVVPEPSTFALAGFGALVLAAVLRGRRRS